MLYLGGAFLTKEFLVHLCSIIVLASDQLFAENSSILQFQRCWGWGQGEIVTPEIDLSKFMDLSSHWNTRLPPVTPLAIAFPQTTADVARAVQCARDLGIRVAPNSGGHCFEGLSRGDNHSIVLDLSRMQDIQLVNLGGGRPSALVQPGVLVGPLNAFLWSRGGGLGVPMGTCMTVGIGGHALGGGTGILNTMFGLTIDNVLGYTMVSATGEVVSADIYHNDDLYWALRGVGPGGLGIVTEVHLQLFNASQLQFMKIDASFPIQRFSEVMLGYQKFLLWAQANPPTPLASLIVHYHLKTPSASARIHVRVIGMRHDTIRQAFRRCFPHPEEGSYRIEHLSYMKLIAKTGNFPADVALGTNYSEFAFATAFDNLTDSEIVGYLQTLKKDFSGKRIYFKAKGFFVNQTFPKEAFETLRPLLNVMPRENVWLHLHPVNGVVWNKSSLETSFPHRKSLYHLALRYEGSSDPNDVEEGMSWLHKVYYAIKFMDDGGTYPNYPDRDVRDYTWRFYRANYPALDAVKRRWDPENYFRNDMSLPIPNLQPRQ